MPRKPPVSLFYLIQQFMASSFEGRIMFCKRYYVRGEMEISPGAILILKEAQPGLVTTCQKLYREDKGWFVGDVDALRMYSKESFDEF